MNYYKILGRILAKSRGLGSYKKEFGDSKPIEGPFGEDKTIIDLGYRHERELGGAVTLTCMDTGLRDGNQGQGPT